jgi:putative sterol carrier protein
MLGPTPAGPSVHGSLSAFHASLALKSKFRKENISSQLSKEVMAFVARIDELESSIYL